MEQIKAVEQTPRPYRDLSIDDLFGEITWNADLAHGLLNFVKRGLHGDEQEKIEVSAVMAFVKSLYGPMANIVDELAPLIYELKIREEECRPPGMRVAHTNQGGDPAKRVSRRGKQLKRMLDNFGDSRQEQKKRMLDKDEDNRVI